MTRAREIANVLGRNIESTTFTATAAQTAFSITHAAGRIQVYMNGLLLDPTVDWTSDGSTVTLTSGATAGDELEVVKFDNLAVADAIPRTGHTGTIDFSDATFTPPAGHVVQVKQSVFTGTMVKNSATYSQITDLAVSITPTSATSKFLIQYNVHSSGYTGNEHAKLRIYRGSTAIALGNQVGSRGTATTAVGSSDRDDAITMASMSFLDSPATTSAITYSVHVASYDGSGSNQAYINVSKTDSDISQMARPISSITVMEIAG